MFASFKKLFRKDAEGDLATFIPAATSRSPQNSWANVSAKPTEAAVLHNTDGEIPAAKVGSGSPEIVPLPVKVIVARLPHSLSGLVQSQGNGFVNLPAKRILQELPKGLVKLSYGELRQSAPPGTFFDNDRHDATMVELPLGDILPRVHPSLLSRRPGQRKTNLSPDITDIFGPRGEGISFCPPSTITATAESKTPSVRATTPVESAPIVMPKLDKPLAAPISMPNIFEEATPAIRVLPTAPSVAQSGQTLSVKVSAVSETWPVAIRSEMNELGLLNATLALPFDRVESALKAGKITFTLKQIGEWIQPAIARPFEGGETVLDLPLNVIAPLFIAKRKPVKPQRKINLEEIPDVFSNKNSTPVPVLEPEPEEIAPVIPLTVVRETAEIKPAAIQMAEPAVIRAPVTPVVAAPKQNLSPNETVKSLATLPGVVGGFIAMQDGLLVAAHLPENFKPETMAAFLPQIFGRMNQYAKELKLGGLSSLNFVAENVPWQIIKTGTVYLVALGKAGEALPNAKLNEIAAELGTQIQ